MFEAVRHGLANMFNPAGRDARQTFWYYVLFVVVLRFGAGMLVSVPLMLRTMGAVASAVKEGADPQTSQAAMMAQMADMMPRMIWMSVAIGLASMVLLAASVVRRLHDSNLGGWWLLVPGVPYAVVLAQMPAQLNRVTEMMTHLGDRAIDPATVMQGQMGYAALGWLSAIALIVLCVRKSSDGPNRFGDAPTRF